MQHPDGEPDLRWGQVIGEILEWDTCHPEVGEVAAEPPGLAVALDDVPDSLSAHVAAQVTLGVLWRGLLAGHQDEGAVAVVLGVQGEDGMARGARPGEEVDLEDPDC